MNEHAKHDYDIAKDEFYNGNYQAAISYLKNAIRLDPEYDEAYMLIARSYCKISQLDELRDSIDAIYKRHYQNEAYLLILDMLEVLIQGNHD